MALRKISVTQAVDTAIMASGDVVATTVIPFAGAVDIGIPVARIRQLVITDPDANTAANWVGELWLFRDTVTPAAANAAHSISDAHALLAEARIDIVAADATLSALNTVVSKSGLDIPFRVVNGATTLYGILVTRATPTFAGGTITISLGIEY